MTDIKLTLVVACALIDDDNRVLASQHLRTEEVFRIVELEGFFVEFGGEGITVDEVVFHQPNGIFVAQRAEEQRA
jgi:hypothetical protein